MANQDYYKTEASVKEYIKMAAEVDSKELIEKLKPFLNKNASVLEIGSGPGTDWKILKASYKTIGSDFSDEFLSHLKKEYPSEEFLKLDAITLETEIKFEGIYSNKVLQHLTDEEMIKSVKRQYDILEPEGIVAHSFWKGEGSEVFKGMFVNYHLEENLRTIFETYFDILLIEDYPEFEANDSIFLIAKKK